MTAEKQSYDFSSINITFKDFKESIQTSNNSQEILQTAETVFKKAKKIWQPKAVFRWFDIHSIAEEKAKFIIPELSDLLSLELGFSIKFLKHGKQALFAVYTIGHELELEAVKASSSGRFLESYLFDLIGLLVLEKNR